MFLGVDFVDGIGEFALQGANFTKQRGVKGELVTRIGGGANGSKRCDKDVKSGKVMERKLSFFGWNSGEGCTFVEATLLKPIVGVSP